MANVKGRNFKVVLIGDPAVGKTTLAGATMNAPFSSIYKPTVGASLTKIPYEIGNETIWIHLWDTAGMEQYRSLAPVYYRDSQAAVLVYDVTNRQSFESLQSWLQYFRSTVGPDCPVILLGNKLDLIDNSTISNETAQQFANENCLTSLFVSAKEWTNVTKFVDELADSLIKSQPFPEVINIPHIKEEEEGCC